MPREWKETSRHTALDVSLRLASPACTAAQPRAPCSRPSNAMSSFPALPWVADWPYSVSCFLHTPTMSQLDGLCLHHPEEQGPEVGKVS